MIRLLLLSILLSTGCRRTATSASTAPTAAADVHAAADNNRASISAVSQTVPPAAAEVVPPPHYSAADSAEIVRLLADDRLRTPADFARKFKGRPYVAATLEGHDPERLIVNLRGLDCATLVETASALALTRQKGQRRFTDFCHHLTNLRYFSGRIEGYTSRLHYLSFWMAEQTRRGLIGEVHLPNTRTLNVRLHYMSRHAEHYPHLKDHPKRIERIAALERKYSGCTGRFLPKTALTGRPDELPEIQEGDIIAIVTRKDGLDYSHQGIAVRSTSGRLHLLHASSERRRVIEDDRTLRDYLARIPHTLGIRVFRLTQHKH